MNKIKLLKKAEKVATANLWEKNGMSRIYVEYNNKKFYIDLNKEVVTFGYGIKGNICTVRDFLVEAEIEFAPLASTSDFEIKLIEKEEASEEVIADEYVETSNDLWKQYMNCNITEEEHRELSDKINADFDDKWATGIISDEALENALDKANHFIQSYRTDAEKEFDKIMGY